jgi:DNA-binding CsgD family transcriptional regulator
VERSSIPRLSASSCCTVAEGHSNAAIARILSLTEAGVGKHIGNVLTKLDLPISEETNRRVLAVLAYLRAAP